MNINKYLNLGNLKFLVYLVIATNLIASLQAQAGIALSSQLCVIVSDVRTIVGIFALLLFIIGGVLYAAANFMPAAGQTRGNMQGWAMGMIIGGIVGLILVIAALPIVTTITSFGTGVTAPTSCSPS